MDISIVDQHPFYHIVVDGVIHKTICMQYTKKHKMHPLTWRQQQEILDGYRDWLDSAS